MDFIYLILFNVFYALGGFRFWLKNYSDFYSECSGDFSDNYSDFSDFCSDFF
ncbi:unnamed protein product [Meloidogyne enterolobii]|uniref:Uncharacterized protein n=1 Tax=Meloidogyne enterolobii TaxID=390850 RepID=A0ACB1AGU9_MELEN